MITQIAVNFGGLIDPPSDAQLCSGRIRPPRAASEDVTLHTAILSFMFFVNIWMLFLICCTVPPQLHKTSHFYIILDLFLLTFNYKTSIKRLNTHKKRSQCVPDAETSSRDWKRNTRCLCQTNEATSAHRGHKGWSCRDFHFAQNLPLWRQNWKDLKSQFW